MNPSQTSEEFLLSIIIPCYNEAEVIQQTHHQLTELLHQNQINFELIYVDDGSKDQTVAILEDIYSQSEDNINILCLSRNFGHQIAVTAGLENSQGDAVVIIDADLQDPPELIPEMIRLWQDGYDVVYGLRINRQGETFLKKWTAKYFYRIMNLLSDISIPLDTGDFRLIDRQIVEALKKMPERDRFLRGLVSWTGYNQIALPYERHPRYAGSSKYPLLKMLKFASDGILSFSLAPLRLSIWIGGVSIFISFVGIIYALIVRLFTLAWVPGWTILFIAILFFMGTQSLILGIVGEYIGRIYYEIKQRPLYLLRKKRIKSNDLVKNAHYPRNH